jgi:hypothetical protein
MLTQAELKEVVTYDPETGHFTWVKSSGNRAAGSRAGSTNGNAKGKQYRRISINKELYLEHRLAFLWMTGAWPEQDVDHISRVESDNRWSNLRGAAPYENMQNRGRFANNKSGVKGVFWSRQQKKWGAQINYRGKQHLLGHFKELGDAKEFIELARSICHGDFAEHGVAA